MLRCAAVPELFPAREIWRGISRMRIERNPWSGHITRFYGARNLQPQTNSVLFLFAFCSSFDAPFPTISVKCKFLFPSRSYKNAFLFFLSRSKHLRAAGLFVFTLKKTALHHSVDTFCPEGCEEHVFRQYELCKFERNSHRRKSREPPESRLVLEGKPNSCKQTPTKRHSILWTPCNPIDAVL